MAQRPVFVPSVTGARLVEAVSIEFGWSPGFALSQKRKNIAALHAAAAERGYSPLLEVSTKSETPLGQRLSAFNLLVRHGAAGALPLECAFQGGKVFEHGGPFTDLYAVHPREARQDARLRESGRIVAFRFDGSEFPTDPPTAFYDWLYCRAVSADDEASRRLCEYAGFTDIEFNPTRSLNCQARSCATFVALLKRGALERSLRSPDEFTRALRSPG